MSEQHFVHRTGGRTCSRAVYFDIKDGKVCNIRFDGGCRGNTQGVARLAEGMDAREVVRRLKGIDCRFGHSCPDELARGVEEALKSE